MGYMKLFDMMYMHCGTLKERKKERKKERNL